jgi:hypothetical protein
MEIHVLNMARLREEDEGKLADWLQVTGDERGRSESDAV